MALVAALRAADTASIAFGLGVLLLVLTAVRTSAGIGLPRRRRRARPQIEIPPPATTYQRAIAGRRRAIPPPGPGAPLQLRPASGDRRDADLRAAHDVIDRMIDRNPELVVELLTRWIDDDETSSAPTGSPSAYREEVRRE